MAKTLPIIIEDTYVRQDDQGRFSLNDLHQASGGESRNRPSKWVENQQTRDLIAEVERASKAGTPVLTTGIPAVKQAEGRYGGTYAARELVYAYAMWISPAFHLNVIRTFDAVAAGRLPNADRSVAMIGQSTGLPTAQLVALQAQGWKIIDRLKAETVRELRADLYEDLAKVFADMGKTAPPLDTIGAEEPEAAIDLLEFWAVFDALQRLGHPVNHSRNPELIAFKLAAVVAMADRERFGLAPTGTLRRLLRTSKKPKFIEVKSVSSAVTGTTEHCWVFRAVNGGAA